MDAHELYAADRRAALGGGSLSCLQQPPQLSHEGEQPPVAAALELLRVAAEGDQVLPPLSAAVHGPKDAQHIQPVIDMPHQAVDAHVPGCQAQLPQRLQKSGAVRPRRQR